MVLFVIIFKPLMFNYWTICDIVVNTLLVLLFFLLTFEYIKKIYYYGFKIHVISALILLMHVEILISTILHHGNIKLWGMGMLSPVCLVLFLEVYSKDLKNIVSAWFPVVYLFLFINVVSILLGGYKNEDWLTDYFLGSKNTFEVVFASFFLISYLYARFFPNLSSHSAFCYFFMVISIGLTQSSTMIIELFIFLLLILLRKLDCFRFIMSYKYLLFYYILANVILLSIFLYFDSGSAIIDILDNTEKGSSSMVARLKMWTAALNVIISNPIMGIGKMTEAGWNQYIQVVTVKTQLHNQIIEYMTTGGMVLLSLLLLIYVSAAREMNKYKNSTIVYTVSMVCFALNIANMTEAYYTGVYYFPFILTAYIPVIIKKSIHKTVLSDC